MRRNVIGSRWQGQRREISRVCAAGRRGSRGPSASPAVGDQARGTCSAEVGYGPVGVPCPPPCQAPVTNQIS